MCLVQFACEVPVSSAVWHCSCVIRKLKSLQRSLLVRDRTDLGQLGVLTLKRRILQHVADNTSKRSFPSVLCDLINFEIVIKDPLFICLIF